jgi:hypothetical protein
MIICSSFMRRLEVQTLLTQPKANADTDGATSPHSAKSYVEAGEQFTATEAASGSPPHAERLPVRSRNHNSSTDGFRISLSKCAVVNFFLATN